MTFLTGSGCVMCEKKKAVAMAKEAAELLSSLESQQAFKLDLREFFEGWFFGEVQSYHSPTNETWKEWNLKMI